MSRKDFDDLQKRLRALVVNHRANNDRYPTRLKLTASDYNCFHSAEGGGPSAQIPDELIQTLLLKTEDEAQQAIAAYLPTMLGLPKDEKLDVVWNFESELSEVE